MNPVTTASKLKTLRTLKGISPEEVAQKAQLDLDDYLSLESGKTAIKEDKLEKVCNALGIDIKEWFETDKSNVFINNGEIKGNSSSGNQQVNCENCYFYQRSDDEMEIMKATSIALKELAERLDEGWISRNLEKFFRKNKGIVKDE